MSGGGWGHSRQEAMVRTEQQGLIKQGRQVVNCWMDEWKDRNGRQAVNSKKDMSCMFPASTSVVHP